VKPEAVVRAERLLGGEAASWERVAYRGWSRNEHFTLALGDGTRAFVKEAALEPSTQWVRHERRVLEQLDPAPYAPRVLAFEDGERPLLLLEDLTPEAHWPPPWRRGDVEAVLATLEEVAATRVDGIPPFAGGWGGWAMVADDPAPFLSLGLASPAWLERALPSLVADEQAAPTAGDALLHGDVRSDNLCLRGGRAILVDWNHARIGDAALDVAAWLPSLALEGGPGPEEVARDVPGANAFAAILAGFFAAHAGLPPPEGAPRVRGFQLAQLEVALPWACAVLDLPPPDLR
jgi:aminoglycoside phosphotransferase (APT) family kinase protein